MVALAKQNTDAAAKKYGLVFNQTESFWLVPWLGGFGGPVFAADGVTPTLNTDAMTGALKFLYDLKYTDKVMPGRGRLQRAPTACSPGRSADDHQRRLGARATTRDTLGDKLGVAPLPRSPGRQGSGSVHRRRVPDGPSEADEGDTADRGAPTS